MPLANPVDLSKLSAYTGIIIKNVTATQRHVGFCYFNGIEYRFLDYPMHNSPLRDWPANNAEGYYYVPMPRNHIDGLVMAAHLARFKDHAVPIPYAANLLPMECVFTEEGEFIPMPLGQGLTCATFISRALAAGGWYPVSLETWKEREDDLVWKKDLMDRFVKPVDAAHAEKAISDADGFRLRPEEIAGACSSENWPKNFTDTLVLATAIIDSLQNIPVPTTETSAPVTTSKSAIKVPLKVSPSKKPTKAPSMKNASKGVFERAKKKP